jgi:hypothetical protein
MRRSTSPSWTDLLQVGTDGLFHFDCVASGRVLSDRIDAADWANAEASMGCYAWPVGQNPTPYASFDFTYAETHAYTGTDAVPWTALSPPVPMPAGSFFWVAGLLSASLASQTTDHFSVNSLAADADFSDTVHLYVDPDPSTPDATYTMASGADLRTPVPEPARNEIAGAVLTGLASVRWLSGRADPRSNASRRDSASRLADGLRLLPADTRLIVRA